MQLTWEPFFLNPNMHEEGQDFDDAFGENMAMQLSNASKVMIIPSQKLEERAHHP